MNFNFKNLIVITGPSGVGKTTVVKELIKKHKNIGRVITYTTRKKRSNERAGRDYNFVTEEKFKKMLENKEMLEWARVYDNYYGNNLKDIENVCKKNKYCLMVLDIQGAETIKKKIKNSRVFFLTVKFEELAERIKKRGKMVKDDFETRQKTAKREIKKACLFDYTIENKFGKIDKAIEKIEKILKI